MAGRVTGAVPLLLVLLSLLLLVVPEAAAIRRGASLRASSSGQGRKLNRRAGLRGGTKTGRTGFRDDWGGEEVAVCVLGAQPNFDMPVNIFADREENTRYVSFGFHGHSDGEGYVESMVKCAGKMPESCQASAKNSSSGGGNGCADCPCELDLNHTAYGNYQRKMLDYVARSCNDGYHHQEGGGAFKVLLIGLGGGALPQHILGQCPEGTEVETVEYDPRMVEAATRFFGLNLEPGKSEVVQGDGGEVVVQRAAEGAKYDAVLVDAFAGGPHVPESCRNRAFVDSVRKILTKTGFVIQNIEVDYDDTMPIYEAAFGADSVTGELLHGNGELPISHLIVAMTPM